MSNKKRSTVYIIKDRIRMSESQLIEECESLEANVDKLAARIRELNQEQKHLLTMEQHIDMQFEAIKAITSRPLFRFKRTAKEWAHWWIGRLYRWSKR